MNFASLQQLRSALTYMDSLVFGAVARAQDAGFDPNNTLRGLVITDEDATTLANRQPLEGLWGEDGTIPELPSKLREEASPLTYLARVFNLNDLDLCILLLCLAPELDNRYERLYAYLQDDVTQRRPTINLLMNLLGSSSVDRFAVWERLAPNMPLVSQMLVECLPDPARPNSTFITFHVKLDRRIVGFLLGDTHIDPRVTHVATLLQPDNLTVTYRQLIEHLTHLPEDGANPMVFLYGMDHATKREAVKSFCAHVGLPLLIIDLAHFFLENDTSDVIWAVALREAVLNGALVLVERWETALNDQREPRRDLWHQLLKLNRLVFFSALDMWEPKDEIRAQRLLRIPFDLPDYSTRQNLWVQGAKPFGTAISEHDLGEIANKFRLTSDQIARAVLVGADWAATRGEAMTLQDLYRGAQAHASLKLDQLAQQIVPRYHWQDLILPPDPITQLEELVARVSHAATVHYDWGFGDRGTPIRRVSALFAGESGTGKTLAAEVIASQLGLVMYKIDLSSVVSKYIGETEKNLKTIFDEARAGNAILFFDEADALFGKRSEVKDAHDRYANIEVAYLLQQIETYDGVAIMATNLRQNLDEAFTRRLDFVVDFPFPDPEYRFRIWKVHFPSRAPLGSDVDLMDLSERYRLAGGNIRNAALASAYLAATENSVIAKAA